MELSGVTSRTSTVSSRPGNLRLLAGVGSGSQSKNRRGCRCFSASKGRCVNLFLVISLILSVSSLLISSLSLASLFPVAGETTFTERIASSPCRFVMIGINSSSVSEWRSRCADFFRGLSSDWEGNSKFEKSKKHGHFYLLQPPPGRATSDVLPETHLSGLANELEARSLPVKSVLADESEAGDAGVLEQVPKAPVEGQRRADGSGEADKNGKSSGGKRDGDSEPGPVDMKIGDSGNSTVLQIRQNEEKASKASNVKMPKQLKISSNETRRHPPVGRIQSDHTLTTLYSLRNDFGFRVNYYVFHTLCFNSTHLLIVGNETCQEGFDAAPNSGLTPVYCDDQYHDPRRKMFEEVHIEEATTTTEWLKGRNVSWWNGTSAILHLDRSSSNVAHFIGKVNGLLALNNLSFPMYTDYVDRVLVLKHDNIWRNFRWNAENIEGFHAVYLADTLSRLLRGVLEKPVRGIRPKDLLGNQINVAGGRVRIGMIWDELIASDHQPMCFEKVVIPGLFKASQCPGGMATADRVRKNLQDLYLSDEQRAAMRDRELHKAPPVLLYIVRNGKRRTFFPESETAIRKILQGTGFDNQIVDFNEMTFKEQFSSVQTADISIALHGANLMNPSFFGRKRSILVEVVPFNVVHRMYESQATDTGLVYLGHQCLQGTIQDGDQRWSGQKYLACMKNPECKERFIQQRKIELTGQDLAELEHLISIARELVMQIEKRDLKEKVDSSELMEVVEDLVGKGSCQPWLTGIKDTCRGNWVSFMDKDGFHICYINYFCGDG